MSALLSWGNAWFWGHLLLFCILLECIALFFCFRALIELYCIEEKGKRKGDYDPTNPYKGARLTLHLLRRAIFKFGNDAGPRRTRRVDFSQPFAKSLVARVLDLFR